MKIHTFIALSFVAILATGRGFAAPAPRFAVTNAGDSIEVLAVSSVPAPSPAPELVLSSTLTVSELIQLYITAYESEEKLMLLDRIAVTKPETREDLRWLFNLYTRTEPAANDAAAAAVQLLTPRDKSFGPFFRAFLLAEDPGAKDYAILGALQLRDEEALPLIRELAAAKFERPRPSLQLTPGEAERWNMQFRALRALAIWDAPRTLELLKAKSAQAPPVAAIIALHYWEQALDTIVSWSESRGKTDIERAMAAWNTDVPKAKLRPTAKRLRALVANPRMELRTRHQAALKLGIAADDAEVDSIMEDILGAKDKERRLLWTAALFASRHPRAIPILKEYAQAHESPVSRAGALYQLGEMLPPDEFRPLLEWTVKNDPDEENKDKARRQLRGDK